MKLRGYEMRFKERIARFMYGRYGADELYRFLFILFYVLFVPNMFLRSYILSVLTLAVLVFATYRSFSRNIAARRAENEKYLALKRRFLGFFKLQKNKWRDRKTHAYRKCPYCKSVLRFPKKKGLHHARCPECSKNFDVKI